MNASASVSVVASVMFGSAMAMLSTGKESFLDNSNDENVAFATRIMDAQTSLLGPRAQTFIVPGGATAKPRFSWGQWLVKYGYRCYQEQACK